MKKVFPLVLAHLLMANMASAQPSVSSLSSASGIPGSPVTISGSGFNSTTANNIVYFGATRATVSSASATSLTVTVPPGATNAPVSVTNSATGLTGNSSMKFLPTYIPNTIYDPTLNFGTREYYSLPEASTLTPIAVGDLDGDGKTDVAVAGFGTTVRLLRNTSATGSICQGSFASPVDLGIGGGSFNYDLQFADLDGDGKKDIIAVCEGVLSVLHNVSVPGSLTASSFEPYINFSGSDYLGRVSVADVDGDGKQDIVAENSLGITLLHNVSTTGTINGGSFEAGVTIPFSLYELKTGDLDSDGKPEVVAITPEGDVAIFHNISSAGTVDVFSFDTPVYYGDDHTFHGIYFQDINGDNKPDLVVQSDGGDIVALENTSTPGTIDVTSFGTPVTVASASGASLAFGDVDGDGIADIITSPGDNNIWFIRNAGMPGTISTSSFQAPVNIYLSVNPKVFDIADLDGDTRPELLTVPEGTGPTGLYVAQVQLPSPVVVTIAPSSGIPGSHVTITGSNFNTTADSNIVYFGAAKAVVNAATHTTLDVTVPIGATLDFVSVNNLALGSTGRSSYWFLPTFNNSAYPPGSIHMDSRVNFAPLSNGFVYSATGDIDGDGKPDIVVSNPMAGNITVYRNISTTGAINSSSLDAGTVFATSFPCDRVKILDIDGDGKLDIATMGYFGLNMFRNTATSGTINSGSLTAGVSINDVLVKDIADIDGDGRPDLVGIYGFGLGIRRNETVPGLLTAGSFGQPIDYRADHPSIDISDAMVCDFDNDGKNDVILFYPMANQVAVFRNTAVQGQITSTLSMFGFNSDYGSSFEGPVYLTTRSGWEGVYSAWNVADVDGDGKTDIVLRLDMSGEMTVMHNTTSPGTIDASSFSTAINVTSASPSGSVFPIFADMDGDGKVDLIYNGIPADNNVYVARNVYSGGALGTGSFATPVAIPVEENPLYISAGDVDGDTKPELIVCYMGGTSNVMSILRNNPGASESGGIAGTLTTCPGSSTTLTDSLSGGTWVSSNTSVATIGSATGIATGMAAGTATISYVHSGGVNTAVLTVNPAPVAGTISGVSALCAGTTIMASSTVGGGSWSSSDTSKATVSASGLVSGIAAGNATISYTVTNSCGTAVANTSITVNPLASAGSITGSLSICAVGTTTLNSTVSGGSWASSNTSVATVGAATGVVSGAGAGTASISYTVTNGCGSASAVVVVTVAPLTSAGTISGSGSICVSGTSTLTNTTGGGSWSSSNTTVASIGAGTGIVTGNSAGTATMSYSVSGSCGTAVATKIVTVSAAPSVASITGSSSVNTGASITLADATTGGSWSASNGNATVNSAGVVTGVTGGTVTISYTITTGCGSAVATKVVTVNATLGGISGSLSYCTGTTGTLSNSTTGGSWVSGNNAVAVIGSSAGNLTALSAGTVNITYALSATNYTVSVITVNSLPANITGTLKACPGTSTTLGNTTTGGTWSSGNTAIATAGISNGIVTGAGSGVVAISYTTGAGCSKTASVTINPNPAAISGATTLCPSGTSALSNPTSGGLSWSSSTTSVATIGATSGILTAVSAGTSSVTYTLGTGCVATTIVTVNGLPPAITGTPNTCVGTASTLANTTSGGTWISSNTAVGTVGASGDVWGIASGNTTITYTLGGSCYRTATFTVKATPTAISGVASTCAGATTTLTDGIGGGTWASGSTSVATVTSGGVVSGLTLGTAQITYTLSSGCAVNTVVSVTTAPSAISGAAAVCVASTTTLGNSLTGGTWASANSSYATVGSATGIVTGIGGGTVNITYSMGGTCRTVRVVTVNAIPGAISGTLTVCQGAVTTLGNSTGTGTWSSSNTAVGTVGSINAVYARVAGISAGTTSVSFTFPTGCSRVVVVTVNPTPVAGVLSADNGFVLHTASAPTATQLSSSGDAGGTWTSSTASVAAVNSSGMVSAVAPGTANISYTVTLGSCSAIATHTVNVLAGRGIASTGTEMTNLALFPNPNSGDFFVKGITGVAGDVTMVVTNIAGQVIYTGTTTVTNGQVNTEINLDSSLPNGMYLLTVDAGEEHSVFRFVISK